MKIKEILTEYNWGDKNGNYTDDRPYGYWISTDGSVMPVVGFQQHDAIADKVAGDSSGSTIQAIKDMGWVRVAINYAGKNGVELNMDYKADAIGKAQRRAMARLVSKVNPYTTYIEYSGSWDNMSVFRGDNVNKRVQNYLRKGGEQPMHVLESKLNEDIDQGSIYFVDIDDTLFKTYAQVGVMKDGKQVRELTNQEYNSYNLLPGEEYDYTQFKDGKLFHTTSEAIEPVMKIVRKIHDRVMSDARGEIVILTARQDFEDKEPFLQKFRDHDIDIDNMYVERAGNEPGSPTITKPAIIANYLGSNKYNKAKMIDDHKGNLDAFLGLTNEFPDVIFAAWLVHPTGKTTRYRK